MVAKWLKRAGHAIMSIEAMRAGSNYAAGIDGYNPGGAALIFLLIPKSYLPPKQPSWYFPTTW
jgi:hypothetical protein